MFVIVFCLPCLASVFVSVLQADMSVVYVCLFGCLSVYWCMC